MQYLAYIGHALTGDLGNSMRDGRPAIQLVLERVPATLALTVPAFLLKLAIGMPAGIYAALHRNSFADRMTMLLVGRGLHHAELRAGAAAGAGLLGAARLAAVRRQREHGATPSCRSSPWASAGAAILARFTRSAMLEVLGQPYIRAASAKGAVVARVVTEHALPNAAIPTITIIGFMVGTLIAGAVVVESVFAWPGIGRLLVVSVANRDLAVVQMHPAARRGDHGDGQHHRRFPLRLARSAPAHGARDDRDRSARRPSERSRGARFFEAWPPLTLAALGLDRADAGGGVRRRLAGALSLHRPRSQGAPGCRPSGSAATGAMRWAPTSSAATCFRA